jgi:hypothetical protein
MRRHAAVLLALAVTLSSAILVTPLGAQLPCPEDEIEVVARADTLFVEHRNAFRNCCYELKLDFNVNEEIIDFYEGETGPPCDCMCCFNLRYSASGFAAGHYTVRVWNGDGTELFGSVEVDVKGEAGAPEIVTTDLGKCIGPTPIDPKTWSSVKEIFK